MKRKYIAALLAVMLLLLTSCGSGTTTRKTPGTTVEDKGTSAETTGYGTPNTEETETQSPPEKTTAVVAETTSPAASTEPANLPAPGFHCAQAFVFDISEDRFVYLAGDEEIIYPASTTKLLTILYARTLLPLEKVITPGNELDLVGPNSSRAYIYEGKGHKLTVEQLIEGMLLPSGNDAAYALAAAGGYMLKPECEDGKEAVSVFMRGLNDYTVEIGLTGSVFINPDGYDNDEHYSTLQDMATVAKLAYKDPVIRKYCSLPYDEVTYASGHQIKWTNTNWCIDPYSPDYYVPEMNGMKTGTVNDHYYCFIGSAEVNGKAYVFGFFGEEKGVNRFLDAKIAVKWIKDYC